MNALPRAPRLSGERGAGLIATLGGVVVFLAFLLAAVQVTVDLYATSAVTAAAYDGARIVAGSASGTSTAALADAEAHVRDTLGRFGDGVDIDWKITANVVALRVRARNPIFVLPVLGGAWGLDRVDRTVRVRIEELR